MGKKKQIYTSDYRVCVHKKNWGFIRQLCERFQYCNESHTVNAIIQLYKEFLDRKREVATPSYTPASAPAPGARGIS